MTKQTQTNIIIPTPAFLLSFNFIKVCQYSAYIYHIIKRIFILFSTCSFQLIFIFEFLIYVFQDKAIKCTVHKITGSIPAGNYIQLPKLQSQSLGLTGKYIYILFKPIPTKYFVVHIDVATQDNLVVRISFSNLFKEFKSTSTWLQFPFLCNTPKGSVHSLAAVGSKGIYSCTFTVSISVELF